MSKETQLKDLVVELSLEKSELQKQVRNLDSTLVTVCKEVVGEHDQVTLDEVVARIQELIGAELELNRLQEESTESKELLEDN